MDNEKDKVKNEQNEKILKLLEEYEDHRRALKDMIKDLEKLKQKIDTLFPEEKLDARIVRFFEEKVKAATGLFNAILDIRKESSKSLKDEIEIRRKFESGDLDLEAFIHSTIDIRKIIKSVEGKKEAIEGKYKEIEKVETEQIEEK